MGSGLRFRWAGLGRRGWFYGGFGGCGQPLTIARGRGGGALGPCRRHSSGGGNSSYGPRMNSMKASVPPGHGGRLPMTLRNRSSSIGWAVPSGRRINTPFASASKTKFVPGFQLIRFRTSSGMVIWPCSFIVIVMTRHLAIRELLNSRPFTIEARIQSDDLRGDAC